MVEVVEEDIVDFSIFDISKSTRPIYLNINIYDCPIVFYSSF